MRRNSIVWNKSSEDPKTGMKGIAEMRTVFAAVERLGCDLPVELRPVAGPRTQLLYRSYFRGQSPRRRHESASQLAIRAYRLKMDPINECDSFSEAADKVGANRKRVSEVKKVIELYGRNDIIELLFA